MRGQYVRKQLHYRILGAFYYLCSSASDFSLVYRSGLVVGMLLQRVAFPRPITANQSASLNVEFVPFGTQTIG